MMEATFWGSEIPFLAEILNRVEGESALAAVRVVDGVDVYALAGKAEVSGTQGRASATQIAGRYAVDCLGATRSIRIVPAIVSRLLRQPPQRLLPARRALRHRHAHLSIRERKIGPSPLQPAQAVPLAHRQICEGDPLAGAVVSRGEGL